MKTLPFAMVLAALTQTQSSLVLGCLVFVMVLLVVGGVKMWRRLIELENVVYSSVAVTKQAKQVMNEIKDVSKDRLS